jgi:hypothetical protein
MDYAVKLSEVASSLSAPVLSAWRSIRQQDLVDRLQTLNDGLSGRVFKLQADLNLVSKDKTTILGEMNDLKAEMDVAYCDLRTANNKVDSLETELRAAVGTTGPRPLFLNSPGVGRTYAFGFTSPDDGQFYVYKDQRDVYAPTKDMIEWAKDKKNLCKYDKIMAVWRYGKPGTPYAADKGDNCQLPIQTNAREKGDCEDTAKRQSTLAHLIGLSDNDYFDFVGPTSFGYHSFNAVQISDADFLEAGITGRASGWYLCEATLNFSPTTPMPLVGSQYWVDNGAFNWNHVGSIKPSELAAFNGQPPGGFVSSVFRRRKLEHGQEKKDAINEYWRQYHGL